MKKNHKTSFHTIIIEVTSIVLAVVLGFIVNEWRENLNNKSKANSALQKITMEIKQNYLNLSEKQKYYNNIISALDSLLSIYGEDNLSSKSVPGWKGINPPILSSSSYKTALTIGVFSYVDFHKADKISKVYLLQDELQKLGTLSIQSLITGEFYNYRSIKLLFVIYNELIDGWMLAYNQVLKANDENNL